MPALFCGNNWLKCLYSCLAELMLPFCSWYRCSSFCCRPHCWWHSWGFRLAKAGLCHLADHLWTWGAWNIPEVWIEGGTHPAQNRWILAAAPPAKSLLMLHAPSSPGVGRARAPAQGLHLPGLGTQERGVLCLFPGLQFLFSRLAAAPGCKASWALRVWHSCLQQHSCRLSGEISSYYPSFVLLLEEKNERLCESLQVEIAKFHGTLCKSFSTVL